MAIVSVLQSIWNIWNHPVPAALRLVFLAGETAPNWIDSDPGVDPNNIADYYRREDGSWYRYTGDPNEPYDPYYASEVNETIRQHLEDAQKFIEKRKGDANRNGIPDIHESAIDPGAKTHYDAASRYVPRHDPLTFDLDGDGLETVGTAAGILFDLDADGVKTGTGWVASDDALLVRDINGNGTIDTGRELFGDSTLKSNGQTAVDGFDALADLDSNADGKISSSDTAFNSLRLWRDLNQDGISQSAELFTLSSQDIASINATKSQNSQLLGNGNEIADLGTYTKTDGSSGTTGTTSTLGDINLIADTFHRQFTDVLDTSAVANLPDMQGSGILRDFCEVANDEDWRAVA